MMFECCIAKKKKIKYIHWNVTKNYMYWNATDLFPLILSMLGQQQQHSEIFLFSILAFHEDNLHEISKPICGEQ